MKGPGFPQPVSGGLLLTRRLAGAPGQGSRHVALLVAQQCQTETRTVRHPEQDLTPLPGLGRADEGAVNVNVH